MRYCDWQPHYIRLAPEIGREIENYLCGGEARWVVTGADTVEPDTVAAILESEYTCVDTQSGYSLWKK